MDKGLVLTTGLVLGILGSAECSAAIYYKTKEKCEQIAAGISTTVDTGSISNPCGKFTSFYGNQDYSNFVFPEERTTFVYKCNQLGASKFETYLESMTTDFYRATVKYTAPSSPALRGWGVCYSNPYNYKTEVFKKGICTKAGGDSQEYIVLQKETLSPASATISSLVDGNIYRSFATVKTMVNKTTTYSLSEAADACDQLPVATEENMATYEQVTPTLQTWNIKLN